MKNTEKAPTQQKAAKAPKTDESKRDVKVLAEVDIPAENIIPDDIVKGMIIRLHPNEVLWHTDDKSIELNVLSGKVFFEIKPGSLSEKTVSQVFNGLKTGRILSAPRIEKVEIPNIEMNFDSNAITARRILDLDDKEFESTVMKFRRVPILEVMIGLEKQDKKRTDRIDFIQKQISLVSNK